MISLTRSGGKSPQVTPTGLKCDKVSQTKQNKSHSTQKRSHSNMKELARENQKNTKHIQRSKVQKKAILLKPVNKTQEGLNTG